MQTDRQTDNLTEFENTEFTLVEKGIGAWEIFPSKPLC